MAKRRLTAAASLRWGIAALVLFLLAGYGVTYFRQQRTINQAQARIDELNATLEDMTRRCPRTEKEFMAVSGVGQYKASRYAEEFLAMISDWEARRN